MDRTFVGAMALVLSAVSCATNNEPDVVVVQQPPTEGTLTVHWTIDGLADPDRCIQSGATDVEISVTDPLGNELAVYRQACAAFATSIPLQAGNYAARATLVSATSAPRTTTAEIQPFTIVGRDIYDVAVDFPANAFL